MGDEIIFNYSRNIIPIASLRVWPSYHLKSVKNKSPIIEKLSSFLGNMHFIAIKQNIKYKHIYAAFHFKTLAYKASLMFVTK